MTKEEYREYLKTPRWLELRTTAVFLRPECDRCLIPRWLARIAYSQDLNAHHKTYEWIQTEYEQASLVPLCRRCHEIEHFGSSEWAAPPTNKCLACDKIHWDIDATMCEGCWAVANFERRIRLTFSYHSCDNPDLRHSATEFDAIYARESARRQAAMPSREAVSTWLNVAVAKIKLTAELRMGEPVK